MQPIRLFDAERAHAPYEGALQAAFAQVLHSGRLVLGPAVAQFEQQFAQFCGVSHAVGVANGSDALELALRAVGLQAGARVLTVANAGGYASSAIRAIGALPVYVDIDPATHLVDLSALEKALHESPAAVIVTHLYGRLAPVDEIVRQCASLGIAVIEDCAQAHGASRQGRLAGSFASIGCFSFYPTKNLGALGDGGALVTRDAGLAERLRALRQYGWSSKYHVDLPFGRNSRLDELQAALLSVKLPALMANNERRRCIAKAYEQGISHPQLQLPTGRGGTDDVVHLYVLRCARRAALRAHLAHWGIDSEVHYPVPDHWQAAWQAQSPPSLPETEAAAAQVLSLPCHPALNDQEIARVIEAANAFV